MDVTVLPDGAPATALKLTGEPTVAFAAGEQMVTAPAIGEHEPVPELTVTAAEADFVVSA